MRVAAGIAGIIVAFFIYQKEYVKDERILFGMAIGYLSLLALLFVIKCAVWLLESKAVYSPDKLLKLKKPFFLGKAKWELIRENALLHKVSQDRFCDFINMLKPYYFTDQKIDFSEPEN